jgi:hypothetical protein
MHKNLSLPRGQSREPASTQMLRLGYLPVHDGGSSWDDHYILKWPDATEGGHHG